MNDSDLFFDTMTRLSPRLRLGDLAGCEQEACKVLLSLPSTPFHLAAELDIANNPADAAKHFDNFYQVESQNRVMRAIYTEMNGFDINPDRWYCDLFSYEQDGGTDDFEWLCDWQSQSGSEINEYVIIGLEKLQAVYESDAFQNPDYSAASYMSSLVVVTKFQRFMQKAATHMTCLRVPLYVTAHDFDYIARLEPGM